MKITFLTALLVSVLGLSACQTVEGVGRDLSTAGTVITQESQQVQSDL